MSEYLDREFVAVPRLPLLTECAPLAAAVAGSSAGSAGRPIPRYARIAMSPRKTDIEPIPRYTDSAEPPSERPRLRSRRPTWRFVRLRLARTAGRAPVVEDRQQVEMTSADDADEDRGRPGGPAACGTSGDSDAEPDPGARRPVASGTGVAGGDGRAPKSSRLESDVREVRRLLQAYALRLAERDAHARVTKQWRLVARVLDRLFFFFYVATIVISLVTIFPR